MSKRRTADQIQRLLREVERDRAEGLTLGDCCRKLGISQNTYHRWRERFDPAQVDDARRVCELETEVERLKRLCAELMLDKQMLQDVAKKKVVTATQQRAAADYLRETFGVSQRRASRVLGRARSTIRYRRRQPSGEEALLKAIRRLARRHPRNEGI
jgi:putative transposase